MVARSSKSSVVSSPALDSDAAGGLRALWTAVRKARLEAQMLLDTATAEERTAIAVVERAFGVIGSVITARNEDALGRLSSWTDESVNAAGTCTSPSIVNAHALSDGRELRLATELISSAALARRILEEWRLGHRLLEQTSASRAAFERLRVCPNWVILARAQGTFEGVLLGGVAPGGVPGTVRVGDVDDVGNAPGVISFTTLSRGQVAKLLARRLLSAQPYMSDDGLRNMCQDFPELAQTIYLALPLGSERAHDQTQAFVREPFNEDHSASIRAAFRAAGHRNPSSVTADERMRKSRRGRRARLSSV